MMRHNNWSLKNKEKQLDTKYLFEKPRRGVTVVDYYLKEDIEFLRQKLIEDLDKGKLSIKFKVHVHPTETTHMHINLLKEQIMQIINKRFGVE